MQTEHENLSPSVNVVHTTGKEVISPLRKEENDSEMNKHEKMHVQSVQNSCFSLSNLQVCDVLVAEKKHVQSVQNNCS